MGNLRSETGRESPAEPSGLLGISGSLRLNLWAWIKQLVLLSPVLWGPPVISGLSCPSGHCSICPNKLPFLSHPKQSPTQTTGLLTLGPGHLGTPPQEGPSLRAGAEARPQGCSMANWGRPCQRHDPHGRAGFALIKSPDSCWPVLLFPLHPLSSQSCSLTPVS